VVGADFPEISLPRHLGHNPPVLLEAARRDHLPRQSGYRAGQDLMERRRRLENP
jgi:serine kinase of HPr protein (carbohydrate metabolism regulator)